MSDFLNRIRCADKKISVKRQIMNTVVIMLTGVALGAASKCLDCTAANDLPFIVNYCKTLKETAIMLAIGVVLALVLNHIVLFHFG